MWNVNVGGRVGSGKFVLENGSVSSKNCTRQVKVAMFVIFLFFITSELYPCAKEMLKKYNFINDPILFYLITYFLILKFSFLERTHNCLCGC